MVLADKRDAVLKSPKKSCSDKNGIVFQELILTLKKVSDFMQIRLNFCIFKSSTTFYDTLLFIYHYFHNIFTIQYLG